MDTRSIDVTRRSAGAEYLSALERLGLTRNALFWAFDKTLQKFVLALVADAIDFAGPYAMSKALIEAYRKSATPAEIDPLVVRMHSPNQTVI